MSDIEIEIDGKKLQAKPNAMVIQVADEAGIYIPRFCYHKQLSIAANCRMCLVEVEKSPKPLPACATPVMAGMKVFTRSSKALAAQKAVMEFLLINHPLDCPICDQGGECELQDLSMGYGASQSYYTEGKRAVLDKYIGPLIETEMTRCIHCTRCVRFGAEIAGMRELGATGRGEHTEIGTYIEHAMKSEVSGNVIDICPVGALTSKPFRFTARPWELEQRPTISPHDCVGSNLNAHMRTGIVMRMVPRENMSINDMWISDRDRFSYEGLYHADRVTKPLIKQDNVWKEVEWQVAIEFAAAGIQKVLLAEGSDHLGALISPSATLEECYLLQKLVRSLGSDNIDHRLRQVDFSDQKHLAMYPTLGMPISELEDCDAILLVGSNIQKEQPAASLKVRKAALKGANIMAVNPLDYAFSFDVAEKQIVTPSEVALTLARIANALLQTTDVSIEADIKATLTTYPATKVDIAIAKKLQDAKKACVLIGNMAGNYPEAALIRALCQLITALSGAQLGFFTEGANAAGASIAGAVPHRGVAGASIEKAGLDAASMWKDPRKAYILFNIEPDLDCANPLAATNALQQADFVVSLSVFHDPLLEQYANVILPIAPFTETSGTFVNAAGQWQKFLGVATAFEEARPGWKVLRVLGNFFQLEGFEHCSSEDVHTEIHAAFSHTTFKPSMTMKINAEKLKSVNTKSIERVGSVPIYSTDALVRRGKALQATQPILEGNVATIGMHPNLAAELQVQEGAMVNVRQKEGQVSLPVVFDRRLPARSVLIASGIAATNCLSELFGEVKITS